jgi:tRNA threonylcarbamoyladenosine biosynthesis protein TsaE
VHQEFISSHSPEATEAIARDFALRLKGGEKIGLCGPLGAGKTRFMQGVSTALLDGAPLPSPTFAIVHDYPLKNSGALFHVDLYRLDTWAAFLEIDGQGLVDRLDAKSFLFIEWADRYPELVKQLDWVVEIRELPSEEMGAREITISTASLIKPIF